MKTTTPEHDRFLFIVLTVSNVSHFLPMLMAAVVGAAYGCC